MAATNRLLLAVATAGLLGSAAGVAAARNLAPLPPDEASSTHGPFEMGECAICHDENDKGGAPGRLLKSSNDLCFDCHEEFRAAMKNHPKPGKAACTGCHSPHNAKKRKLLL